MDERRLHDRLTTSGEWDARVREFRDRSDDWLCGWGSEASQVARLHAVARQTVGKSVIDVGCGSGRLADMHVGPYLGLDQSAEMVKEAGRRRPHCWFAVGRDPMLVSQEFDFVVSAGVTQCFVHMWEVLRFVSRCWDKANEGIAITFLVAPLEEHRLSVEPKDVIDHRLHGATRWLIDRSYLPHDWLLVVTR